MQTWQHKWIGNRAVRVDKDGRRLPGEYVIDEVDSYRGGDGRLLFFPCLRRTDAKKGRVESFSRNRVRIDGVDKDFAKMLAASPDDAKLTDADRLREVRRILADVLEQAVAVRAPLPADLVQRAWRAVEGR